MAVNTELVRIDTVEKELWDKIVESAESSSTGGGVLVVNAVYDETTEITTLDKTWQEIDDAIRDGSVVLVYSADSDTGINIGYVYSCYDVVEAQLYAVGVFSPGSMVSGEYHANSEDGYPTDAAPSDEPGDEPGGGDVIMT